MRKRLLLLFIIAAILFSTGSWGCKPKAAKEQKTEDSDQHFGMESLYQTESKWDNQKGDTIQLGELAGKIPVITMVFTRCTFACPRIVADLKAIEQKIPSDRMDEVVFVLVSFDSERDHTSELKTFSKEMKLGKNWQVLHGSEEDVRELSMLLNVKYKKQPNGDFTHSSGISLLDKKGAIVYQKEGLGNPPEGIIEKIKGL